MDTLILVYLPFPADSADKDEHNIGIQDATRHLTCIPAYLSPYLSPLHLSTRFTGLLLVPHVLQYLPSLEPLPLLYILPIPASLDALEALQTAASFRALLHPSFVQGHLPQRPPPALHSKAFSPTAVLPDHLPPVPLSTQGSH